MPRKREPVDDVLDAIVWMRRKSKKHEAVDDFIDALLTMRRNTKKKVKKVAKRRADETVSAKGKGKGKVPKARPARRQ